jgi:hypothetical protein
MRSPFSSLILILELATLASASDSITIGMGPFTVSVPDSWSIEKAHHDSKLQASSPDSKAIGKTSIPVMVRIEEKKKVGESLEDLQEFLIEKLLDSPEEGKSMIEKSWGEKADRLAVDALKVSKPTIVGIAPNQYLTTTVFSEFDVDGEKVALIGKSYWIYRHQKAYFMRIVTPIELADQYAKVIDETARSVEINNKGEQDGAGHPATRSESKSEGSQQLKPESEGRSR